MQISVRDWNRIRSNFGGKLCKINMIKRAQMEPFTRYFILIKHSFTIFIFERRKSIRAYNSKPIFSTSQNKHEKFRPKQTLVTTENSESQTKLIFKTKFGVYVCVFLWRRLGRQQT